MVSVKDMNLPGRGANSFVFFSILEEFCSSAEARKESPSVFSCVLKGQNNMAV